MKKSLLLLLVFLPVFARGQTITGTITASQCVVAQVQGHGTVGINVSGSWTGTIQPKVVADPDGNATASNAQVTPYSSSTAQSTITANGDFSASVVGASWFQLCGNTVTSTATVKITAVRLAANRNGGGIAPGPGSLTVTSSSGDFCAAANTFYNAAFTAGAKAPTVDTTQASGPLTCSTQLFSGWLAGSQGGELRLTVPINTDYPFIIPTKFSIHGNLQGDCSSNNAAICPTATFRSNFPVVQGCTSTCAATTATVAFLSAPSTITTTSESSTTGTFNTSATCFFIVGAHVQVSGVSVGGYNGVWSVTTGCAGGTSFQATLTASGLGAGAGGSASAGNEVYAGTINGSGVPTVGGTGSFTGGACGAVTPGFLCGYDLYICPATVALCIPSSAVNLGRVVQVFSTSQLLLETNVHSPITAPASTTGYQYVFIMPVVQMSTVGNSPACSGSGNACISNNQEITRVMVDANDGASDLHTGYVNLVGQEGVGTDRLAVRSARWECYDIETTGAQNSGPYINVRCGGNANNTGVITVPLMVWQVGYLRSIMGCSLVTTEPAAAIIANSINNGGIRIGDNCHMESATDGLQLGNATVWPWAGTGTGARGVHVDVVSGNATLTNVVHVLNNGTVDDITIGGVACGGATSSVVNDVNTDTVACGSQEEYRIGASRFASGIQNFRKATLALSTTSIPATSCAAAQTVTITGISTASALGWTFASTPIGVTGYGVGGLQVSVFPTTNTANFVVCNITAGAIVPGAISAVAYEASK